MISANGGLPAERYTPQVTQRWPRGSEPASPVPIPRRATWVFFSLSRATRGPSSAPFAPTRSPAPCLLCAVRPPAVHCGFFLVFLFSDCPPPLSLCVSCLVVSCPCGVFFLRSSLHARTSALHLSSGYGSPGCLSQVTSPSPGVPLGGPRPIQVNSPPSRHSPLFLLFSLSPPPPSPLSRPPSYCCSPPPCALRCSSPRQGCISRALTPLSVAALSSVL